MAIEDLFYPLLKHYTAGPQWLKSTVGGAYSRLPARARYGKSYAGFFKEAQLRDPAAMQQLSDRKLMETLKWAAETVPAYAHLRDEARRDRSPAELLAAFPLLEKQSLKQDLEAYASTQMPESARLAAFTGGSTSIPMKFYLEKFTSRSRAFAYNQVFDAMTGIGPKDLMYALRGRTVPGSGSFETAIWMYDPIKRYVHLSSDHLEPEFMEQYVAAMRRWKCRFIQAFPSALYPLARWLKDNPAPDVAETIESVQLFSENAYPHQVELIRDVFNCDVYIEYGQSERVVKAVTFANESRFHFWPSYGRAELIGFDGKPVTTPGQLGEIVGTAYDNKAMPLVRYRTGDMGVLSATESTLFPGTLVLDRVEGRLQEFLVCRGDRLVSIATIGAAHFDALSGAERMQFEQHEVGKAVLKVQAPSLNEATRAALARGLLEKTQGGLDVEVVRVDEVERTRAGKHRLLIQHLDISRYLGAAHIGNEE
jgi:phenylacetate-CoA ligase